MQSCENHLVVYNCTCFCLLGWVWAAWTWNERQQYKLWSPYDKRFGAVWTQTYTEQDTYFLWGGKTQLWLDNSSIYHGYCSYHGRLKLFCQYFQTSNVYLRTVCKLFFILLRTTAVDVSQCTWIRKDIRTKIFQLIDF